MHRNLLAALTLAVFLNPSLQAAPAPTSKASPKKQALKHYLKGLAEMEKEQFSSAIESLETATQLEFGWSRAFAELGHAYYRRAFSQVGPADRKDAERAIDVFETAVAIDSEAIGNPHRLYYELALCYQTVGWREKALQSMKRAASAASTNPMPAAQAAQLAFELGRQEESIDLLKDALERAKRLGTKDNVSALIRTDKRFTMVHSPRHGALMGGTVAAARIVSAEEKLQMRDAVAATPTAALRKAKLEAPKKGPSAARIDLAKTEFGLGHYRDALDVYHQILKEEKNELDQQTRSMILEKMGACYRKLGLLREAVESLGDAATQNPGRASIFYELALTYSLAGRFPKALEALQVSMGRARDTSELRRFVMSARTDPELDSFRENAQFRRILEASARRTKSDF